MSGEQSQSLSEGSERCSVKARQPQHLQTLWNAGPQSSISRDHNSPSRGNTQANWGPEESFPFNVWMCSVPQSHQTLCDSVNCGQPGSSVPGILQERILSGLPVSAPGDLPDPGIEPQSLASTASASRFFEEGSLFIFLFFLFFF